MTFYRSSFRLRPNLVAVGKLKAELIVRDLLEQLVDLLRMEIGLFLAEGQLEIAVLE